MTAHTQDDAFHEIQLNGKQLVFLVMAATVVSVAIFLCGVLVGRNVRAGGTAMTQVALAESPSADILPPATPTLPASTGADDVRAAAPPPTNDDASANETPSATDVLKPAAPRPVIAEKASAVAPPVAVKPLEPPVVKPAEKATPNSVERVAPAPVAPARVPESKAAAGAPADSGYAVQVAALNIRDEADAIAKRLSSKGYAAYVQAPTSGTPSVFRVRVGTFKTRREAESVASKLQKEEQFKPWVTR